MWGQPPSAVRGAKTRLMGIREQANVTVTSSRASLDGQPRRLSLRDSVTNSEQDLAFLSPSRRGVLTGATLWVVSMRYPFPLD
jgi:hypothetical protein